MKMKPCSRLLFCIFLPLCSVQVLARKDVGEYWKPVIKDEPILESTREFMVHDLPNESVMKTGIHCKEGEPLVNEIGPGQSLLAYNSHTEPDPARTFIKDFEPGPNLSVYNNNIEPDHEKPFVKDFEPGPNLSVYNNDIEHDHVKPFLKDFEPGPNLSVYNDDKNPDEEKPY